MARLMIHRDLLRQLGNLPAATRKKVMELVEKFQTNSRSPGIHLEHYREAIDPKVRSARVDQAYRAIVIAPERGENFLLLHVDHHDEAYRWCRNKRFEIHANTSVLQIFDVEEVQAAVRREAPKFERRTDYPLARLTDDDLFAAGVPRPLIPAVRAIQSDDAFEALASYLPKEAAQVLLGVACGQSVDDALNEILGPTPDAPKPASAGDFSAISETQNQDLVFVDGEDQLKAAMAASLEEWRIFLHPSQRKIVDWSLNGPIKVNGAAGTGKTVVLMHRAVNLAASGVAQKRRVLVTTYTPNLSVTLRRLISKLAQLKGDGVADRIEVTNLHDLARTICLRAGWKGRVADIETMDEIWTTVFESPGLPVLTQERPFVKEEFAEVIEPFGIMSEDEYLTTVRTGRPRLTRPERKQLWIYFNAVIRQLKHRSLLTPDGLVHEARLVVEGGGFPPYDHVLVDEVQDFGLEALRLVRALSPVEKGIANPLFVAGDGHQRIYKSSTPLSRAGIDIRGRSRRLRINYRTTEEIRRLAQQFLSSDFIDDLDGERVIDVGDQSVFRGLKPDVVRASDGTKACGAVVDWVRELTAGKEPRIATNDICVCGSELKPLRSGLAAARIDQIDIRSNDADPQDLEKGVRLSSMARIKGLEFRAVAAVLNEDETSMLAADTLAGQRLRCRLYVALTRARERALICLQGPGTVAWASGSSSDLNQSKSS